MMDNATLRRTTVTTLATFGLRLIEFSRARLAFDLERKRNNYVEVSFAIDQSEFKGAHA
jgi:hypothetical protein